MSWETWRKHEITPDFVERAASLYREGLTHTQVARKMGIPPRMWRVWLEAGEEQVVALRFSEADTAGAVRGHEADLYEAVNRALGDRDAGWMKAVDDPKWKLEKAADDFGPAAQRVEISGPDRGPIAVEGRAVVGLADVVKLALETGQGHLLGLSTAGARELVPAAGDVLPDPAGSEQAAGALPAPEL